MASLHFCQECNNLLYPKADQQRRIMVYACRICAYDEIGENKCVYRNDLLTVTKEQVGVTTDLMNDPTLVRALLLHKRRRLTGVQAHANIQCPSCGHDDAVYFQDQSKRKETRMILFFVCTKCNHSFTDPTLPKQEFE
ncbi:hypothetical protein CERSUDRAFT_114778 [Gelatoporia subvermispora B]|uniref:DNA-directed RNA polymerase subunit n=1 Tax=Ceriporiopsis subvermispora (strain B) TaxID=914234 RepID=M2PKN9_CERS8|nr:hypothetical protein CERSUDRAFT_114778 [Gelatoporia subvermispora B]